MLGQHLAVRGFDQGFDAVAVGRDRLDLVGATVILGGSNVRSTLLE